MKSTCLLLVHGFLLIHVPLTDDGIVLHAAQRDRLVSRDLNQIPVTDRRRGRSLESHWENKKRVIANVLAHAQHPVNLSDAKPMQDVGHQRLEAHVFDAGDVLRALEIVRGAVFASLSGIVHDCVE